MLPVTSMQKTMSTAYRSPLVAVGAWPGATASAGGLGSCSVIDASGALAYAAGLAASGRAKPGITMSGWSGWMMLARGTQLRSTPSEGDSVIGLIISAIVVGLIVGALGRLVVPGRQDMSIWLTIAIGIVAALIGSLIASALGVGDTRGIDWIKLIIQVALAAAGVALVVGRFASGTRRPRV
jgi:uncharacterized membrane protein YeaQ/YmgE (transglycosylase-associated protein family)